MNIIKNSFEEFLNTYNPTKLGFIVSQSNVENFLRTEFAWYLARIFSESVNYKIYIELQRIDLQVISTTEKVNYFVEFGHIVNLHNVDVERGFNEKYTSDLEKFTGKNKGKFAKNKNKEFTNHFIHINLLTEFNTNSNKVCEIEESAATFVKYGKTSKAKYDINNDLKWKKIPFTWKNSNGSLVVDIKSYIL